jgi:hypothetical protein
MTGLVATTVVQNNTHFGLLHCFNTLKIKQAIPAA